MSDDIRVEDGILMLNTGQASQVCVEPVGDRLIVRPWWKERFVANGLNVTSVDLGEFLVKLGYTPERCREAIENYQQGKPTAGW